MIFTGTIIASASGSVGGLTFSRNRGGAYIRARAVPVDPGTPEQIVVRNALTTLVTRWGDVLTQLQRDAWDVYAFNVPVTNALGNEIFLTGLNMYTRTNVPVLQAGFVIVDAAPVLFNLGSFTEPTYSNTGGLGLVVAFDNTDAWANEADSQMFIYASRPQNVTINFFKGPYRFAGSIEGATPTPPTSPANLLAPFFMNPGQKLFAYARVVRVDGRLSSLLRGTFIAT